MPGPQAIDYGALAAKYGGRVVTRPDQPAGFVPDGFEADSAPSPGQPFTEYGALLDLIRSGDPRGLQAAGKLTPSEQKGFFDFQTQANKGRDFERLRQDDTSVENLLMAAGAAPIVRAAGSVSGVVSKAAAAYDSLHPIVKYEALKGLLGYFGVPGASAIAALASGRGAKAPAASAEAAPVAAPAPTGPTIQGIPIEELRRLGIGENAINATLRAQAPRVAPSSPGATLNELRPGSGETLFGRPVDTPSQLSPYERAILNAKTTLAAPPAVPASTAAPATGQLIKQFVAAGYSPSEIKQSVQWLQAGVSPQDVVTRVDQARQLLKTSSFAHLPTSLEAAQAATERNATGKWPQ